MLPFCMAFFSHNSPDQIHSNLPVYTASLKMVHLRDMMQPFCNPGSKAAGGIKMIRKMLCILLLLLAWHTTPACARETSVTQYVEKGLQTNIALYNSGGIEGARIIKLKVLTTGQDSNLYLIAVFFDAYLQPDTARGITNLLEISAQDRLKELNILDFDIISIPFDASDASDECRPYNAWRTETRAGRIKNVYELSEEETRAFLQ